MTTREEIIEKRRGATVKEIKRVQEICRSVVNTHYRNSALPFLAPHVEREDLEQECLIAWLKGENIYTALGDIVRRYMPLDHRAYAKGAEQVSFVEYDDNNFERNTDVYAKIMATELLESLTDPRIRFILESYFIMEMTLREISEITGIPIPTVQKLRDKGIMQLKGEEK